MDDEKTLDEIHLKRTRITNILLAIATIVSLIFLLFAFIQKTNADNQKAYADKLETELAVTKHALETCQDSK